MPTLLKEPVEIDWACLYLARLHRPDPSVEKLQPLKPDELPLVRELVAWVGPAVQVECEAHGLPDAYIKILASAPAISQLDFMKWLRDSEGLGRTPSGEPVRCWADAADWYLIGGLPRLAVLCMFRRMRSVCDFLLPEDTLEREKALV